MVPPSMIWQYWTRLAYQYRIPNEKIKESYGFEDKICYSGLRWMPSPLCESYMRRKHLFSNMRGNPVPPPWLSDRVIPDTYTLFAKLTVGGICNVVYITSCFYIVEIKLGNETSDFCIKWISQFSAKRARTTDSQWKEMAQDKWLGTVVLGMWLHFSNNKSSKLKA